MWKSTLVWVVMAGCGSAPVCDSAWDLDCNGVTSTTEWPPCVDCTVECTSDGFWHCERDGVRLDASEHHGFRCSDSTYIEDHIGIRPVCDAAGSAPRCVRDGEALPTDLAVAECIGVE